MNSSNFSSASLQDQTQGARPPLPPAPPTRPWPILLLTTLGAWLSGILLLIALMTTLEDSFSKNTTAYASASLLMVGLLWLLRAQSEKFFLECIALPYLIYDLILLTILFHRNFDSPLSTWICSGLFLALSFVPNVPWARTLLIFAGFFALIFAVLSDYHNMSQGIALFFYFFTLLAYVITWAQQNAPASRLKQTDPFFNAAALCVLGLTMQTVVGFGSVALASHNQGISTLLTQNTLYSTLFCAMGIYLLARKHPQALSLPKLIVYGVALGLSAWQPPLGALILLYSLCTARHQPLLANLALICALSLLMLAYYSLNWTLSEKALGLALAAGALGLAAYLEPRPTGAAAPAPQPSPFILLALTLGSVLILINLNIWQKEHLIQTGEKLYIRLAPVDPRSLMQRNYMALNFEMPRHAIEPALGAQRPFAIVELNNNNVATFVRLASPGDTLTPTQRRVQLTPKNGQWTFVTDAWFFQKGQGQRWEAAKYGEFRLAPDGTALLVGMANENLEAITP